MNNFMNACRHVSVSINSQSLKQSILLRQYRAASLYSPPALGLDKYESTREKVATQMIGLSEKFRIKMKDFVDEKSNNMIFTEDLKSMVHLGDANDLDLLKQMIAKFNNQNKELRFGSFIFGPVVMRMFHHLDKPDEALRIFEDPETSGFFDQFMSFQVLMDLLYKHQKYDECLRVFEYAVTKQTSMTKYPKHLVVLALAACYKQNTKASFEYAKKLWNNLSVVGHIPMRRAVTFFAALALNQGSPHIALEVVSTVKNQSYVTVRNIKISALADLDRPDDALPILRALLNSDTAETQKSTFCQESIDKLKESIDRSKNPDPKREFSQILKGLQDREFINDTKLDSLLCAQIQVTLPIQNSQDSRLQSSYNRNNNYIRKPYVSRPGLSDDNTF